MSAVRFRLEPPCKSPLIGVFICYNRIMKKTLIIGTMQTEWLEYVKELPKGNEDYEVLSSRLQLSGSALKAASLYQQFGFPYEVIAPVGRGSAGETLSAYLEEKQIDVQHVEGIHGSSTLLVDSKDRSNRIYAPGVEFDISNNLFMTIDPENIDRVLVFGDALISENAKDVIDLLQEIQQEVYFAPGSYFQSIEDSILDAMLDFHPIMILEDTDLLLENFEYLETMISGLQEDSHNTILFLAQFQGLYGFELTQKFLLKNTSFEDAEYIAIAYSLARLANVDSKNALLLAQEMGIAAIHHQTLSFQQMELFKQRLKGMILHAA